MSAHFGLSQAAAVSMRPTVGSPVAPWESGYRRVVLLADLVIIAVCLRVGLVLTHGSLAGHLPGALAGMSAVALIGGLLCCRVWEQRILGQGAEEFRRLGNAVIAATVVLGLTALAVDIGYFRPWVFAILPATGLCLLTSRYVLRQVLHSRRKRGLCMHPVLVAGSLDEERYGMDARRRLLVKPGLTGLWQVSGRSDLTSEETVRLDLRYVENWSFAMDLVIVWKTVGAVLRGNGAY